MKTKIFTLVLSMALFGTYAMAQNCVISTPPVVNDECIFTTGTFTVTVPTGYSVNITVEAWGGGGGGRRGGGGGGGYVTNTYSNVSAGSYPIVVVVGAGVSATTPGNLSSYNFDNRGTVTAGGGAAGGNANAGSAIGGTGSLSGGAGGIADGNAGGGGGGSGPGRGSGGDGVNNGAGGTGGAGGGGAGGASGVNGTNGAAPGGGGGGGGGAGGTGGTGASGRVIVRGDCSEMCVS